MLEEDEVSLYDYIKVIRKRKWVIIAGTFVCVLAAGLTSLMLPPVYQATLDLKIGRVWDTPIEDPHLVSEKLTSEFLLAKVIEELGLEISSHRLKEAVRASILSDALVRLVARADTPQKTTEIVNGMANLLVAEHRDRYERAMTPYCQYEKDLAGQIKKVESGIAAVKTTISQLQRNLQGNATVVVLLQMRLEQEETKLIGFRRELQDVHVKNHSAIHSYPSQVDTPPIEPAYPVGPNKKRIILIAAVLGGLASLFIAFFIEYLEKMRGEDAGSRRQEG